MGYCCCCMSRIKGEDILFDLVGGWMGSHWGPIRLATSVWILRCWWMSDLTPGGSRITPMLFYFNETMNAGSWIHCAPLNGDRWMGISDAAGIQPRKLNSPFVTLWLRMGKVFFSDTSFFLFGLRKIFRRACQPVDPWALTTMLHYSSISGRSSPGETLLLRWPDHFLRQKQKGPTSSQTHSMGRQEEEERKKTADEKTCRCCAKLNANCFLWRPPTASEQSVFCCTYFVL